MIGQIKCPQCGRFMPSDAVICPYCGLNLNAGPAVPMQPPAAGKAIASPKKGGAAKVAAVIVAIFLVFAILISALSSAPPGSSRADSIPDSAVKMTVADDLYKPVVHSTGWTAPVPMPGPINTAGAEDSPFITPDGSRFFFFFTPDVNVPVQKQLIDKVTGIWWCQKSGDTWTEPEKIVLSADTALDGAEFVQGNTMWFASIRAGNLGEIDYYTSEYANGKWGSVTNAGSQINVDYDIGEMHISADGDTMYFHAAKSATNSDMDIWQTTKTSSGWSQPVQVPGLSTGTMEGYPFVTQDGNEIWYTGWSTQGYQGPAIFRCVKSETGWGAPEEIISNFAGECTLDSEGNIYFVHHYYGSNGSMIEADIYVAYNSASASSTSSSTLADIEFAGSLMACAARPS